MKRRDFLKATGIGIGVASVGLVGLTRKSAVAGPFGEFPPALQGKMIPAELRAKRVLEVFLYGGLSPWETLYLVPEYGTAADPNPLYRNTQYHTFPGTGGASITAALNACAFPAGTPVGEDFANDDLGMTVQLGPFAYPLRQRNDVKQRTRLLVQAHTLEPHEAAVPFSLTGKPIGTPTMAGLGAHMQRYQTDRPMTGRKAPYSYVFSTASSFAGSDNILAAMTVGSHPGRARPLRIRVDSSDRLIRLLDRTKVGTVQERQQYDALLGAYVGQYRDRLRWNGAANPTAEPVRAVKFADLESAATNVQNSDAVVSVLDPSYFAATPDTVCTDYNDINVPKMSVKLAAHLLTHPTEPASYACIIDTGIIEASGGGGYDTHTENSHDQARNFKNLLTNLMAVINAPGESDPAKLDLDDTLIVLNTEFGRTPWAQDGGNGRNHHPYGYVTAMIGGPITSTQSGIYGAIGPDGRATTHVTPGENRMGALLAMGIWPFAPEAFGVSDVQGAIDEPGGVDSVTARVLGYSP